MSVRHSYCLAFAVLCFVFAAAAQPVPLAFNTQRTHHLSIKHLGQGEYEIVTLGEDPWIELQRFVPDAVSAMHAVLAFEYFSPEGVGGLEVYYGPPINSQHRLSAGSLGRAESWLPAAVDLRMLSEGRWTPASNQLRLDFGRRSAVTLRIRRLQLREPTAEERRSKEERDKERQDKLARESRINAFYRAKFPHRVDGVTINQSHVIVRGTVAAGESNLRLLEVRPEVSMADHAVLEQGEFILGPNEGLRDAGPASGPGFEIRLPRTASDTDRTTSRWALAAPLGKSRWKLHSHWKYATDLGSAASYPLPRVTPRGVKGMGGVSSAFPLEELVELGVHNVTINIDIGHLMDAVPHPGWQSFLHGGRTWHVHPSRLAEYDALAKFCSQHDIVASGILLVTFANSALGRMLVHPEADRAGHYAMPNCTSGEGVAAYEAVIEFLARRYCAPGSPHGRIANWIIHNEVGYGWEWTNMGRQPPMLYMDHYLRSMRLVHDVTRRHDPHARVFISLTHHWNNPSTADWKSYCNRDLLNRLAESSRVEGDFAWGVAYHPYPQNLRRPDAWNDTQVADDFETPLITPKNISVLDRWMHRSDVRDSSANVRGVLLSEQGFNTPDYSDENQRLQAAGFVYMWRQMRGLKSIEAFHNHRWVDHPHEGGLLLGLRKLPSDGKPYGGKKFAWDIYKSLDTPGEKDAVKFADPIIGGR